MMSSMQHEPSVVLPSIHEMFPEYLMRDPAHSRTAGRSSQRQTMSTSRIGSTYPTPGSSSSMSSIRRHSAASDSSSRPLAPHGPHASIVPNEILRPHSSSAHSIRRDRSSNNIYLQARRGQSDSPIFSFDVLRSDPSSSSLQHIASSATLPSRGGSSAGYSASGEISNGSAPAFRVSVPESGHESRGVVNSRPHRSNSSPTNVARKFEPAGARAPSSPGLGYSAIISFPMSGASSGAQAGRGRSPDDPDTGSDGDLSGSNNGKKHVCPTCSKRFNRPSSLRIHVNTHTGATPFRCPWPNCAREFNVNSNMRRHYRNHTTPGISRPQNNDTRRRRTRGPSRGLVFVGGEPSPEVQNASSFATPPISSLSTNEDSEDGSDIDTTGNFQDDEEDELDSLPDDASPTYESSGRRYSRSSEMSDSASYDPRTSFSRYSQSHMRSAHDAALNFSSSSTTPPPVHDRIYSPSAPYSRSFADTKVSTALRPAFHTRTIKEVTMSDVR